MGWDRSGTSISDSKFQYPTLRVFQEYHFVAMIAIFEVSYIALSETDIAPPKMVVVIQFLGLQGV